MEIFSAFQSETRFSFPTNGQEEGVVVYGSFHPIRDKFSIPDQWTRRRSCFYGSFESEARFSLLTNWQEDQIRGFHSRPMGKRRGCSLWFLPSYQRQGFYFPIMGKKKGSYTTVPSITQRLCFRSKPMGEPRGSCL